MERISIITTIITLRALYSGVPIGGQVIEEVIEPLDVIELRTQTTYESNGWDFGGTWV